MKGPPGAPDRLGRLDRLLAILRLAGSLPGYRCRFREVGLRLPPTPTGSPEREWAGVAEAFVRLRPLDRAEVRAAPADFLAARTPVHYRGTSSGTGGRGHLYFADGEWNRVRLECRMRALRAWSLEGLPILNLASRLWPASERDASLVGVVGEAFCDRLAAWLARGPAGVRGYPSRLCEVATAWRLGGRPVPAGDVRAVICTGECLFDHQATHLAETFGAPVVNEYGCHEAGLSGVSCPEHGLIHLDDERAWIEHLDGEIVATDLWNRVMPMVRYRCGDRVDPWPSPCPCGRPGTAVRVLGRREGRIRTRWGTVCEGEVPMPALPGVGPYQAARLADGGALVWAHPVTPDAAGPAESERVAAWARTVLEAVTTEVVWLAAGEEEPPSPDGAGDDGRERWLRRVVEGPWDLDALRRTLPDGSLEAPGRLLLAVAAPEVLTGRLREGPAGDLLAELLDRLEREPPAHLADATASGWIAPAKLLRTLGAAEVGPGLGAPALREAIRGTGRPVPWASPRIPASSERLLEIPTGLSDGREPPLGSASRVLAVIPHYRCEPWLAECLESVRGQTRPPDAVVVIDDASPLPPREIVADFPEVYLLTARDNVGPYRLVQTVVDSTDFDAYLFQDADDWSARDRLEILLAEADRTGAELVGSQELRVMASEGGALLPVLYPLDVGAALAESPGHPLLHPTSLVSRRLLLAVGGVATSLRFGGDTEMLLRAVHRGRAVNVPDFCYFRRRRPDSLTTAPDTGLDSPSRLALLEAVKAKALCNLARARSGGTLDLEPLARSGAAELTHVSGPPWPPAFRPRRGSARGR